MLCPKCGKVNLCSCKSCNPDSKTENVIIYTNDGLCKCYYCHYEFDPCESLDYEWDLMIDNAIKKTSPEICYEWITGYNLDDVKIDRNELINNLGINEFTMKKSIEFHLNEYVDKISSYSTVGTLTGDKILNIKTQLIRNKKLNQIL